MSATSYGGLLDAGWMPNEAEEICAYARDTSLSVQDAEGLARDVLRRRRRVTYGALFHAHVGVTRAELLAGAGAHAGAHP